MGLEFGPADTFPKNTWSYYFNTVTYRGKFTTAIFMGGFYIALGTVWTLKKRRNKRKALEAGAATQL